MTSRVQFDKENEAEMQSCKYRIRKLFVPIVIEMSEAFARKKKIIGK
jgi:hypothetical protein